MPANLPPQYHKAEQDFRRAQSAADRLELLREMFRLLPKHKGTEKLQAELKQKLSRVKDEIESGRTGKKSGPSYRVPHEGAGQVVLIGPPNSGKSSLLAGVTRARPEIAAYPFTTRLPIPGMATWQDTAYQLVDLPAISRDFLEPWAISLVRSADAALLVLDLSDDDGPDSVDGTLQRLLEHHVDLVSSLPHDSEDESMRHLKAALVANKLDTPGATDRLDMMREWFQDRFPVLPTSCVSGEGLESFVVQGYDLLEVIRIYTKVPGKPADRGSPFTIPIGSTVADLAIAIHRDLGDSFKFARVWGTDVFEGQTVKRDHVLHDGDVVELHA